MTYEFTIYDLRLTIGTKSGRMFPIVNLQSSISFVFLLQKFVSDAVGERQIAGFQDVLLTIYD